MLVPEAPVPPLDDLAALVADHGAEVLDEAALRDALAPAFPDTPSLDAPPPALPEAEAVEHDDDEPQRRYEHEEHAPQERPRVEVELLTPEEGVSPGQACVFYETGGTRVLGGGWITR